MQKDFTGRLLHWNETENTRKMPWKGEKDPYKIWLSEIILQQTRVEQGLAYYERFIAAFPSIRDLALAADEQVFKLWEGLGYYSRCRNLLATARFIAFERNGIFPNSYEDILALKGVGPYTAAAIASFAYDQPFAVLDGNVFRVISRFFGISTPIDSSDGKNMYAQLANSLLDFDRPGAYNQAIMDFGAVICKPQLPLCEGCIQAVECQAFRHKWVGMLPVKSKSLVRKTRFLNFFILSYKGGFYVRQRTANDIWKDLFEWVLLESDAALTANDAAMREKLAVLFPGWRGRVLQVSAPQKQQLTHQNIEGIFTRVELEFPLPPDTGYQLLPADTLRQLAFPRFITRYLEKNPL
ncbi:MAG TPA: A/G-specific adenine glycosylase [Flavihumibacter sp.]|nr:A/G-specific adenine glycosylase [Flavihumibacter sp.]